MGLFGKKKTPTQQIQDPKDDYYYGHPNAIIAAYNTKSAPWFFFGYGNQIPTAGAMAYGNQSQRLVIRPLIGAAIGQAQQFRILNNVFPVKQNVGLTATTGLGGLAHGQNIMQPLIDPYNGDM